RLTEWVTDFTLAGKAALEGPRNASRTALWRVYYLGLAPYDKARQFLGISGHTWVNWTDEIRRRCGAELIRREMFPPRKFFSISEVRISGSPTRNVLPACDNATRVLVASR